MRVRWLAVAAVLGVAFVLLVSTGPDDPYISFWPAHTLVERGELLNYDGERVEQSSSLLWVLVLALAHAGTRASLSTTAWALGWISCGAALFRATVLTRELGGRARTGLILVAGTSPSLAYWSFSGMETMLVAWLVVELAIAAARGMTRPDRWSRLHAALATAALLAARPEAQFVLVATWIACAALARGPERREALVWLAVTCAGALALAGFRWTYFGAPLPLPVYAKYGAAPLERIAAGIEYAALQLRRPFTVTLLPILVASPWLLWTTRRRPDAAGLRFALLLLGAGSGFILTAGGDWMPAGRFFAHLGPLAFAVAAVWLGRDSVPRSWRRGLSAAVVAAHAVGLAVLMVTSSGLPLWEALERDDAVRCHLGGDAHGFVERANRSRVANLIFLGAIEPWIETWTRESHGRRLSILSGQAGLVAFYLTERFGDRIEFVDRYGLSTTHAHRSRREKPLGSSRTGMRQPLREALSRGDERALRSPDVIFDIHDDADTLAAFDYQVVLREVGSFGGVSLGVGPYRIHDDDPIHQYLAVRRKAWGLTVPDEMRTRVWSSGDFSARSACRSR